MNDIIVPDIYKKISSDNYLINSYNSLFRSKAVYFFIILIENLLNLFQQLETFIRGFNPVK